jgi:hypothetical protein
VVLVQGHSTICSNEAALPWSTEFDDPIVLPDGRQLLTLKDAADYIAALPQKISGLPKWQLAIETLMLCSRDGPSKLARIAVMHALSRNVVIPFNRDAKKFQRKKKEDRGVSPSKRRLDIGLSKGVPSSQRMNAGLREPTARQIEIFRLRCQGLSYAEIGRQLRIRRNVAGSAARSAATRLIRARPTLENAPDRALALEHFPEIAVRFLRTE